MPPIGEDPNGAPNNTLPFVASHRGWAARSACDSSDRTGMRDYVHVVVSAQAMSPRSSWPLERVWLLQLVP
jgi:hypothetical protein